MNLNPQLSLWKREKVCEHVENFGRQILIFSNRFSSSAQGPGAESEDEEDDEEEAVVCRALEIGNMWDGDPVVECLPAMFGDVTSLSPPAKRERERERERVGPRLCLCVCGRVCM